MKRNADDTPTIEVPVTTMHEDVFGKPQTKEDEDTEHTKNVYSVRMPEDN